MGSQYWRRRVAVLGKGVRQWRQRRLRRGPQLKEAFAQRATRLGIPASQLAHFLLLQAWQRLEQGEIDPEPFLVPATSTAFRNNLDVGAVVEAVARER